MTKNPWPKIQAKIFDRKKNHQKIFRHFFKSKKKIIKKIFPKKIIGQKFRQKFFIQKITTRKNFFQKSKAEFSIKISNH